MEEREWEIT